MLKKEQHHMQNFIDRKQLYNKIKDGECSNDDLNIWLKWSITKYATELIDLILSQPNFNLNPFSIKVEHLNKFIEYNDFERFKYFLNEVTFYKNGLFGGQEYKLMKDICWFDKIDFLELIIDRTDLDFSFNENIIIRRLYANNKLHIVSMLLERPEIKSNKELYEKYSFLLRRRKLSQLKKRIYTDK
jgi:hypothetical protein